MAVKDDVDICLNIAGIVADSSKQASKIVNDTRIKRLKKKASEKTKKTFQKFQSNESPKNSSLGAKKRIKQKSLATIVAKNLERAKSKESAEKPLVSVLKKTSSPDSSTLLAKQLVEEKKQNESNKPPVSFLKLMKNSEGKVILARKRKIDPGETKKSLSSIFKSTESTEIKLLKNNEATVDQLNDNFVAGKQNPQLHKRKFETNKTFQDRESKQKKFKNFNEKFDKNKNDKDSKKNTNQSRHNSGKISSLFGNNPDIPNIGQRLVKPVDEKVFTAEKFSDLNIHAFSVSNLEQNMQITTMTTVQKKAIPVILTGQDVLIRSQTGSGKTLSYALPIIETLHTIRPKLARNCGTKALVIVPTRELALQSYECFLKLIKPFTWIVPGYLVGGEKRKAEKARLRKGCTILVTTPGRLLDHIKHTKALRLDSIKYFVLDEADRMLDMGYEKDISEIVAALKNAQSESNGSGYNALQMLRQHNIKSKDNSDIKSADDDVNSEEEKIIKKDESDDDENETVLKNSESIENSDQNESVNEKDSDESDIQKRQTILLSATLTHAVEKLAGLTMHDPVIVDAARDNIEAAEGNLSEINEDFVVPQSVTQSYIVTPPKLRMVTLSAYIAAKCQIHGNHKTLVFMATQDMVDYHIDILSSVLTKPQDEDDDESDPLVDVEFFKLHGNMTQKERTEVFKTFRQTNSGVLLCTDVAARGLDLPKVDSVVQYTGPTSLRDYVHRIGRTARAGSSGTAVIFLTPPEVEFVRMLEARKIRIKQDDMDTVLGKLVRPLSRHNSIQATATALQNEFEELVLENKKYYAMACKAYTSWIRFYSSYPREMREVFNRKDLHLGHYAKSFALRDPPQKIGTSRKIMREKEETEQSKPKHQNRLSNQRSDGVSSKWKSAAGKGSMRQQDRRSNMFKQSRMLNTSENDSGLEPIKKSKKHQK